MVATIIAQFESFILEISIWNFRVLQALYGAEETVKTVEMLKINKSFEEHKLLLHLICPGLIGAFKLSSKALLHFFICEHFQFYKLQRA